ncbi:Uncharacterised protein [uncultured archaeon]|nr:Uncharacterised protein [uncultured archaeon]
MADSPSYVGPKRAPRTIRNRASILLSDQPGLARPRGGMARFTQTACNSSKPSPFTQTAFSSLRHRPAAFAARRVLAWTELPQNPRKDSVSLQATTQGTTLKQRDKNGCTIKEKKSFGRSWDESTVAFRIYSLIARGALVIGCGD